MVKMGAKRSVILLLVFWLGILGPAGAETVWEAPLLPASPEVLAQGGSFVANSQGYNALFYNPAGFSVGDKSSTSLSVSSWVYADPLRLAQRVGGSDTSSLESFVADQVTGGGFGLGAAAGIGYVGHGLGLAAVLEVDSYLHGATAAGAAGDLRATVGFVAGFSLPVEMLGTRIHFGGGLRPMIRITAPVDYLTMLGLLGAIQSGGDLLAPIGSADALYGYGFGIDLGAIVELGDLRLGIAVRDFLNTGFTYTRTTVDQVAASLSSASGLPAGGQVADVHAIPMNVTVGAAYHLDLGPLNRIIDPIVHASLDDIVGLVRGERPVLTLLHAGAEARVLRFLTLRGGIQQGHPTFGAGLRLAFFDVNAAVFTRELGAHAGERPSSGVSVEAALRF